MEKRRLYMDYSATTPIKKEVLDAMMPYLTDYFGMHLVFTHSEEKQKMLWIKQENK